MSSRKKQKAGPGSGVGYGGDDQRDKQRRTQGRAQAAAKEMDLVSKQLEQLKESNKSLAGPSESPPSLGLVDSLRQVLRNHDPNQWSSSEKDKGRRQLLETALQTCDLIVKHHPKALGDGDDEESILCALEELAQTSELIVSHNQTKQSKAAGRNSPEVKLAQQVLATREKARSASSLVLEKADCLAINSHENYRKAMRPFSFEFVDKLSGHAFEKRSKGSTSNSSRNKALLRELLTYKTALPVEYGSSIFVRADQSRSDLLRALILGPESTPYANGCFMFDIYLPTAYPNKAPEVKFLTTGGSKYRMNPNLYHDGKGRCKILGLMRAQNQSF